MKKFIMIFALITMGFAVTAAFSDDNTNPQNVGFGHICISPMC